MSNGLILQMFASILAFQTVKFYPLKAAGKNIWQGKLTYNTFVQHRNPAIETIQYKHVNNVHILTINMSTTKYSL